MIRVFSDASLQTAFNHFLEANAARLANEFLAQSARQVNTPPPSHASHASPAAGPGRADSTVLHSTRLTPAAANLQAMIDFINRPEGASVPEIMSATHWAKDTVRGTISSVLRSQRGMNIESRLINGQHRYFHLRAS